MTSACVTCSTPIASDDKFCGNCGSPSQPTNPIVGQPNTGGLHADRLDDPPPPSATNVAVLSPTDAAMSPASDAAVSIDAVATSNDDEVVSAELQATLIAPPPKKKPPASSTAGVAASPRIVVTSDEPKEDARRTPTGKLGKKKGTLEPGTLLTNRYEIVERLGGGGMGAVYLAKDKNLGDALRAVKEMIQSQLDEDQQAKAIEDFKRESMLLVSLEHASIPTIYDYFFEQGSGRFYLVMKYIAGGDLQRKLNSAPAGFIDEEIVTTWAIQVADVLDYLHDRKPPIIYRDLKPANLMLDENNGRVMLIDFGIARWVAPQEKGVTAVGTMGYAPPELFSGRVQPASDLYSLGATMFHMLTGADPQDNPLLIFDFTKNPLPRQINASVSDEMEQILMRAVEHNADNRFRTAADMRAALISHLEKLQNKQVTYGASIGQLVTDPNAKLEAVFCGFCGGRITTEDLFCAHCGARQPISNIAAHAPARATAKLVVMGTTELDSAFSLVKESNLVGRSDPVSNIFPEIDLSRFDPQTKVSRRHARIWREGETFLVEDLGSINGTVINDAVRLVPRQPRALSNGDYLRLGETTLHFMMS